MEARTRGPRHVVGREAELAALNEFVEQTGASDGLVLTGEAGVGKTTLWEAGVEAARERGIRVLVARPSEIETTLSLAGLADLLEGVDADTIARLPTPQAHALEVALLRAKPGRRPPEPRAVSAACLGVLRQLARSGPVLVAVDDLQWLDSSSAEMLAFAARRLDGDEASFLLTARAGTSSPLVRALDSRQPDRVEVRGLSLGAIRRVLAEQLGLSLPRTALRHLFEVTAGNPLFALEIGRVLAERGVTPGEPLPVPDDVQALVSDRISGLPDTTQEVLLAAALLARPEAETLRRAHGGSLEAALEPAERAGIARLEHGLVVFAHPLHAAGVVGSATAAARLRVHRQLAEAAPEAEERARHLALATAEPSREIASILEGAAASAHARGAPATAAELAEQAVRLTPPADVAEARRRLFLAADRHDLAGDTDRAISLLERVRDEASAGVERAAVLVRLADVQDDPRTSVPLYSQALAEADGDYALEAAIHIRLARSMAWGDGTERGAVHAELAIRAAGRTGDVEIRCRALATHGDWHFRAGRGIPRAKMDEAVRLERSLASWPLDRGPTDLFSRQLVWVGDLDPARRLLLELRDAHRTRDDADGEASAIWWLALLEWRAGNWQEAERHAAESLDIRTQLGHVMPVDGFPGAVIAAHRGRIDDARTVAHRDLAEGEAMGIRIAVSNSCWVLGFVELSRGDAMAALPHLRRSYELRNAFMLEPGQRLELGDLLEALISAGELEEADEVLASWRERAEALDRAWALALLARCRALLLAARGDVEGAFATFGRALSEHARSPDPFHHARTLLALGRTQRRFRKWGPSRSTLHEALAIFEATGADGWAEVARSELARVGARRPAQAGELTEAERRTVELAAQGLSNKEIARALVVTVPTVERHLSRAYRKLGVRSRGQLARRLPGRA